MERQMRRYHKNSNGFTMAEMLITVAIIVILCGFGFVAVIAHQRNLKRMEMDETAQEIFIAAQNHLTAARANGQWSSFLEKTAAKGQEGSRGTEMTYQPSDYNKASDADEASRKFYYFTTENTAVKNGAEALILPEGSIDETLRGHHFYVEYDAASGTVFGVFYTDSDHPITEVDAKAVSRTEPNDRRDYKADGKRTIIGYYGGALGELNSPGDLYAPSVAVRNAESLVLYVVDKNYYRPVSSKTGAQSFKTKLKLTFEGVTSGEKAVKEVDPSSSSAQTDAFSSAVLAEESAEAFNVVIPSSGASAQQTKAVKAEYYAIVLDSIVRKDGHFANLFPEFIPGEDIRITVTLTSDKAGEDVSQTVTVNSLFNSVKTEKNLSGIAASKTMVTVSNPRHLENLSTEVSGVDFAGKQIVKDTTVDTVSVVRNLFWDEDAEAENVAKAQNQRETVTAFLPAIASATGMKSTYGYYADGNQSIEKKDIQVYSYTSKKFGTGAVTSEDTKAQISKGACYGITNTAIQTFEGNNHMLAAFRFEGMQEAALINQAAAVLKVSDLMIADATSCVTGEVLYTSDEGNAEMPTAALLIAKANSGYAENNGASVENVQIVWYPEGANKKGLTTENSAITAATDAEGTMVYSENGIASLLIGSIDADHKLSAEEGQTAQQGEPTKKFTIKNVTIQAGNFNTKKTVNVGVEGNIAAGMIGEIRSGAVTIDGSKESGDADTSENNWKTRCKINGKLTLNAMKGTDPVAGGLIGKVANTVTNQEDLILQKVYLEADTLQMNGLRKEGQSIGILGGLIGSVEGGKSVKAEDADLIAKNVNVGIAENSQEWNAGTAGGIIGSVTGGTKTELKNVRFTFVNSRLGGKQAAGGVIGNFASGEGTLESVHVLATGQNENAAEDNSGKTTKNFRDLNITVGQEQPSLTVTADQTVMNSSAGGFFGAVTDSSSQLSIRKSSLKTISMDAESMGAGGSAQGTGNADLTVTGTNVGGLIGYCAGKATTIGDTNSNDGVILTVQGSFTLGENGKKAGNAGGLVGKIGNSASGGNNVSVAIQNVPLTVRTMTAYAEGTNGKEGTVGGFIGNAATNVSGIALKDCNLSANSVNLGAIETASENAVKAAGGAIGRISSGTAVLENLTVLTPKADADCGEGAEDNFIKVTASQGKAGGLVGVAESGTESLQIANAAVSGSGVNDQIEAGSSAGGLAGETQAAATSISNSMASMYVRSEGNGGNGWGSSSTDGAGGLIGSASGTVTIRNSYSGGRTSKNEENKPAYQDKESGQGRYNVFLVSGSGAAGGLVGKSTGTLNITNAYSTSSVKANGATSAAGGLIGDAQNLTAGNTYCTGRVYGASGTNTGSSTSSESTANYGYYAGKLGSISSSGSGRSNTNYYLKGMDGAPQGAVGTLNGNSTNIQLAETILTSADYYTENCPLKLNESSASVYYYDGSSTQEADHYENNKTVYPFKTVINTSARALYNPNTGIKNEGADENRYSQIGDWEVPEKAAATEFGPYALIYYERIWNPDTKQLDPTFYYHGYAIPDGVSATDGSVQYTEIKTPDDKLPAGETWNDHHLLTSSERYVAEDGYLLLVSNEAIKEAGGESGWRIELKGSQQLNNDSISSIRYTGWNKELNDLTKFDTNCPELAEYSAYILEPTENERKNCFFYWGPSNVNNFGTGIVLWKKSDFDKWSYDNPTYPKVGFTYTPFFADAVRGADEGRLQSVSKSWSRNTGTTSGIENTAQAIIRSAKQFKEWVRFDNNNYGFLSSEKEVTIEQQFDITFAHQKVKFYQNGKEVTDETEYSSPTIKTIGTSKGGTFRSTLRPGREANSADYYVLDGLNHPLVGTGPEGVHGGTVCDLQITNMHAQYVIGKVQDKNGNISTPDFNGSVHDIYVKNSELTDGVIKEIAQAHVYACKIQHTKITNNGFSQSIEYASKVSDCTLEDVEIGQNGFAGTIGTGGTSTVTNCTITNAKIGGDGFAHEIKRGSEVENCSISNAEITGHGFAETIGNENASTVTNCTITNAKIGGDGFAHEIKRGSEVENCSISNAEITGHGFAETIGNENASTVTNCTITNAKIGGDGFAHEIKRSSKVENCSISDAEITGDGFARTIGNDGASELTTCTITNATIGENGFIHQMNSGKVSACKIVNATIGKNGFINQYAGTVTGCAIYADKAQYDSSQIKHYKPYKSKNGTYDYVAIGIQPNGTRSSEFIVGFAKEPTVWGAITSIKSCYVAGSLYGADVSGFTGSADKGAELNNNYANVVIEAGQEAYGFAQEIVENNAKIQNCHALGVIRKAQNASGFVGSIMNGTVSNNYTAFWTVSADTWYPFYKNKTGGNSSNNYYLTECSINTSTGAPNTSNYNTNGVQGKTYQELSALSFSGQVKATSANTKAYYKFMPNDSAHSVYPYPMPADMTAYGDWSYYHLGAATLVYYEKIGDQYYLHGVTADANGTEYMTIPDTLLNETGKTVTDDGYLLILKNTGNEDGSYRISFDNVNGGNFSGEYTMASEEAGKAFKADSSLTTAIKAALGENENCQVYRFDPINYLTLDTESFSALDTYAQYSGGVGLTVTQGSNLTAKFSFLPIFADTVTAPTVQNVNGKTEISFASVQKDAAQDGADYIIRSSRQLELLSDWDGKAQDNFDKDLAKRYSYLSSTNTGYKNHLVIRQDMDIQAPDTNRILFGNIDGTYKGQAYTVTGESAAKPVKLSGLKSDFAKEIAPSGMISSLVVEDAKYELDSAGQTRLDVISASTDLKSEGSNNEFVRYNRGTISDVTIQNSDLGTGGLVYQNEYVKPSENAGDDYRSGVIQNCVIRNSDVKGAGLVWKNLGGSITDSSVENCKAGFAGFVQKNVSKALGTDASGNKIYAKAVVDNCSVRNIVAAGNGFAGNNTGMKPTTTFSSTEEQAFASCRAEIRNCSVVNGVISGYGFAYENEKNGLIENCQIYGDKSQYEEYLTEAKTWTGGQEKRRYYPYTDPEAQRKAAYELVTLNGTTDGSFSGAGFAGYNDENCVIANCSVTGTIDWKNTKSLAGFIASNKGEITGSYSNVSMGSKANNASGKASGFVNKNEGSISFCHTLGTIEGNSKIAGFTMENPNGMISCSYSAMWSYNANNYSYFSPDTADGIFTSCYALSKSNGTEVNGITKVKAETLKSKTTELSGVTAGTAVKTVAYGQLNADLNETSKYPFPCGSSITNYGDWKENVTASGNEKTVTLLAGSSAVFAGEAVPALMSEEMADEDILQEEGPREIQAVLGEDETELNLSEFVPQMKGWKLLGWLITSPSELSTSEKTTTVSDVVTKINKLSDGDAEASGSSKAVYELETGTKSYHYAPDAVITVTEDMTLSAVWVPDDDTIEKAKDGTLRMDENGNILDDENEAKSTGNAEASADPSSIAGTTETPEEGAKESSTAGTTETPEAGTTESSTAGTTKTPEEGTTESSTTGTTESPEEGTTESSTTGTTEMSETGATESTELSSSGTETSAENGGGTCYEIYQAEY